MPKDQQDRLPESEAKVRPTRVLNYPPPRSDENRTSRAAENLSPWRSGLSESPKFTGLFATLRPITPESELLFDEFCRRAGPQAVSWTAQQIDKQPDLLNRIALLINAWQSAMEVQSHNSRTQGDEPAPVNFERLGQRHAFYTEYIQRHKERIGQKLTVYLYRHMWFAIASIVNLPAERIDTGEFFETLDTFRGSGFDYPGACDSEIERVAKEEAASLTARSAPDFECVEALEVRFGTSSNPVHLLLSEMDKAGERDECERVTELAEAAGVSINGSRVEALRAIEILSERDWWGKPQPTHYINRALSNDRTQEEHGKRSERRRAERAGWKLVSLNRLKPNQATARGQWPEDIETRLDREKICDVENVPADVREVIRARYNGDWEALEKKLSPGRIAAARQKLKKSEYLGRKLAQSQALVGYAGPNSIPTWRPLAADYLITPMGNARQMKKK